MGLTRTEEAGNPDTVRGEFVEVAFGENAEAPGDIAGDDILFQLGLEVPRVIGLDDAVDGSVDWLYEQLVNFHGGQRQYWSRFVAR